jgi:hypothetical protein
MQSHHISRIVVVLLVLALWIGLLSSGAHAWKPKTHIYTANIIADDAKDGKVTIPPYGEFEISDTAKQALANMDFYRAGSIGPDGFPDLWTGQSYIHPKTRAWVLHLWDRANKYNDPNVWAFTYGFYLHVAGDSWCHDWVNWHAGGAWPSMEAFQKTPDAALLNVTRHMAVENSFDKEREKSEKLQAKTIALPREFVLQEMVLDPGLRTEMNPMIQALAKLHDEKKPFKDDKTLGIRTYNARWYSDLDKGLRRYVEANEHAWKQYVEKDKNIVTELDSNVGNWANDNLFSMLGAPDVVVTVANAPGKVLAGLANGITALLNAAGIDIDVLRAIKDSIVNAMMKSTIGMTKDQFKEMLEAEATTTLFPTSYDTITREIGTLPTQANWPHGPAALETDPNKSDAYVDTININAPIYNTVILGKIILLSPKEYQRLVSMTTGGYSLEQPLAVPDNVMLENWLVGIDFSRQCQWIPSERPAGASFLGYANPYDSPVYQRIFKSYPPIFSAKPAPAPQAQPVETPKPTETPQPVAPAETPQAEK